MNRKKWQGITCVLLASLMMSSVFATSTRNADPKPVVSPKQIETQQPTSQKQNTSAQYPTEGQSITPIQSVTPNKETLPKTSTAPTQTTAPSTNKVQTKVSNPVPTAMPNAQSSSSKEVKKEGEKIKPALLFDKKDKVEEKKAPSCSQNKKDSADKKMEAAPKKEAEVKKDKEAKKEACEKKTFTLDHFKMIVCTLKQLGMQESEIADYIKQGKKLEDILKAEKINPKKFKKCIIKQYNKVIDEGAKEGQLTKEQCKQLKVAIKETVKNWLPQDK